MDDVGDAASDIGSDIESGTSDVASGIEDVASDAGSVVEGAASDVVSAAESLLNDIYNICQELVSKVENFVVNDLESYIPELQNYLNESITDVYCDLFNEEDLGESLPGLIGDIHTYNLLNVTYLDY